MLSYLIEMLICQTLFLGLYQFFKTEPFFRANRLYLLGSLIVSLILPLLNFSQAIPYEISQTYVQWMQPLQIGGNTITNTTVAEMERLEHPISFQWNTYPVIYGIGFCLYLFWFIFRNRIVFHYLSLNSFEDYKYKPLVIIPKSHMAFSFWDRIYLGAEIPQSQRQVILEHEYQHLKQKHSWDMMFVESLQFLMWFNPLIYIYKNQLRQIHEFEADQSATKSYSKDNYINTLLNQSFGSQNVSFVNTFFHSSNLKKRIKMLHQTQSSNLKKLKYLLIIPVMLIAVLVSCTQDELAEPELTEEEMKEEMMVFVSSFFEKEPSIFKRIKEKPSIKEILKFYDFEIKNNYSEIETNKIGFLLTIISTMTENDKSYHKQLLNEINNYKGLKLAYEKSQERLEEGRRIHQETQIEELGENTDIPYALIDNPPHPNICSELSGEDLKKCTSDFIAKHINENFDIKKFEDLEPKRYRTSVQFKIDKNGKITNVRARGPSQELEIEAKKAVESLPQFIPGEQDGKKVGVLYGLPINFVIPE